MAVITVGGLEHRHAPNPRMHTEDWSKEYPTLNTDAPYLINKYTGDILPNTPEFRERSDVLEPYYGAVNGSAPSAAEQALAKTAPQSADLVGDMGAL